MSFIGQVCLHIEGICYSDRSSTVQQNDSDRTGHRQQKNNIQIYKYVQNGKNTIYNADNYVCTFFCTLYLCTLFTPKQVGVNKVYILVPKFYILVYFKRVLTQWQHFFFVLWPHNLTTPVHVSSVQFPF